MILKSKKLELKLIQVNGNTNSDINFYIGEWLVSYVTNDGDRWVWYCYDYNGEIIKHGNNWEDISLSKKEAIAEAKEYADQYYAFIVGERILAP